MPFRGHEQEAGHGALGAAVAQDAQGQCVLSACRAPGTVPQAPEMLSQVGAVGSTFCLVYW